MKTLRYQLTIYNPETGDTLFTADSPTEEMMLEKLGSWERAQEIPQCVWCGAEREDDERYCSKECAETDALDTEEAKATGN